MTIPIAFQRMVPDQQALNILAADVGATKTHLALYKFQNGKHRIIREAKYSSAAYGSFLEIVEQFQWGEHLPDRICIGFAGPIFSGRARATNLDWEIDVDHIREALGVEQIFLLNDLEAHAYGLSGLGEEELELIKAGKQAIPGNAAIIAPGTGLGEAGLFWDGTYFHPCATEGGHTDFGPRTEMDLAFYRLLQQKHGHVSWERLVSGPGILEIYTYLRQQSKLPEPAWLAEEMETADPAAAISHGARMSDPICEKTMDNFFRLLAIEGANLVLKLKATGGLYIGGGIVPKNLDLLDKEKFIDNFLDAGRMRALLEEVSVRVILNENTALLGAAYFAANSEEVVVHKQTIA